MVSKIVSKRELIPKAPKANDDNLLKNVTKLFRYCPQEIKIVKKVRKKYNVHKDVLLIKLLTLFIQIGSLKLRDIKGQPIASRDFGIRKNN